VSRAPEPPPPDETAAIVVVLDGVRWQDVFDGADAELARDAKIDARGETMPTLASLARLHGAALGTRAGGAPVLASGPNFVSLPGYSEIFRGRPSSDCQDNDCAMTARPTLADEARAAARDSGDVAVFASWPEIARAASAYPTRIVVSTGRHTRSNESRLRFDAESAELLDRGAEADPYPGRGDFRPDRFTADLALRYLAARRPRFMFLGLGEPDEVAHKGDYAAYLRALREADRVIGALASTLEAMGERGKRTTVWVTADHGRAANFRDHGGAYAESARTWLVAFGYGIAARGVAIAPRPRHLADIAPTVRALLGLEQDRAAGGGVVLRELLGLEQDTRHAASE
jgi:hypothetical protein